jgi:3-phosphoshikimate 1-carboxyvinyltransferase
MARVIEPLRLMGAKILARKEGKLAPIVIKGGTLKGIEYALPQASAQVKSALLLAGLHAKGPTRLKEGLKTRDHTERLLKAQGAPLFEENGWLVIEGSALPLKPFNLRIPGDFSSAAFFIVGALIKEGSELVIEDVWLNPLRTGMLRVLKRMGAKIEVTIDQAGAKEDEPRGTVWVRHSSLVAADILEEELPSLIDEVPALCVAAAFAEGKTRIFGAGELRVKETDRIKAMALGLKELGVGIEELTDGLVVLGGGAMRPGRVVDSFLDHRIAMAFAILGCSLPGGLKLSRPDCVGISYPGFWMDLEKFAEVR